MSQMSAALEVADLRVTFATAHGPVKSVDGVSFSAKKGRVLCIVGESGSGKSVTARAIMGLIAPPGRITGGSVRYNQLELRALTESQMAALRGDRIAMIFQNPMTSLNPAVTVGSQVAESLIIHRGMNPAAAQIEAIELLHRVRIPDAEKRHADYPGQFSGGMRQRIMIAAALSCRPDILIADEPTTALDVSTQAQILSLLREIQSEVQSVMIMITHDLGVVASIADDVLVMYSGRVAEMGPVGRIFAEPRHPYTQGLLRTVRSMEDPGRPLLPIPGAPPLAIGERRHCPFAARCSFVEQRCHSEMPRLAPVAPDHVVACHVRPQWEEAHG
jgi:oligopeptide/dipeptide ABC transporter ATP-binding protein